MQQRKSIKIDVEDIILIESAEYTDQFLRPYVTELRGDFVDKLQERMSVSRRFTPAILANIANQFMVPDYQHRGIIQIPNGWHNRRGRFILTLRITTPTGDRLRQIVMGYTNEVGFSEKSVSNDLEFYINNMYMMHESIRRDRDGHTYRVWIPSRNNDILSDRNSAGIRGNSEKRYTMRPEDVYSAIDASQTMDLVDDVTDARTTLHKKVVMSRNSNRLAGRFMSNVLSARQKALDNDEMGGSSFDPNDVAQGYSTEDFASEDLFLAAMENIRDKAGDWFTYRDLLDLDPTADDRCELRLLDDEALSMTRFADDDNIADLSGQEEWDRVAALISIAVPALMLEHGIHNISFQAHNQLVGGAWHFEPANARSLIKDVDISTFIEKFEDRLIDELLVPITGGNLFDVGLKLTCRAFGEVDFTLYWDGKGRGRYVVPCFTNSRSSPIITNDGRDLKDMSTGFSKLFDAVLPGTITGSRGRYTF